MTVISNNEIRLMLYCSSFSQPLGLMIHLQVGIYFTMTAVILLLWGRPCLSPAEEKAPQQFSCLLLLKLRQSNQMASAKIRFMIELCKKTNAGPEEIPSTCAAVLDSVTWHRRHGC